MNTAVVRLSINVSPEVAEFIRDTAKLENRSITEVVRRSVSVYKFVAYDAPGTLFVEDENGVRSRVMVL